MKKGDVFYKSHGGPHKNKCYIVKVIKDGSYTLIVYKWYGKVKQWWHYCIETVGLVEMYLEKATLNKGE